MSDTLDAELRITELESELTEMKDRWLRSKAEAINVRSRADRAIIETKQYAVQKFTEDMVEIAAMLHEGFANLPPPTAEEPQGLREGLASIERNFLAILQRHIS